MSTGGRVTVSGSPRDVRPARGGAVIAALATGFVMGNLDVTAVNVAGPSIQRGLGATLTQLTWVVDGYVLTFASLLLLAGGLANRFGPRATYLAGMVVFFVASASCAFAPSTGVLVGARFVQGAGAALFMPGSLSLLVHSFPDQRTRTRMLGLWSAMVAASSGIGPTLGGLVVGALGWRAIFLLNLPIGLAGILATLRFVAPVPGRATRLALPGHGLVVLALGGVSFALIQGPRLGWGAPAVLGAVALAAAAAALLAVRERRAAGVLPWHLFANPRFGGANAVGFLFNFSIFGSMFLLGLFFQHARGASPLVAGLELLPVTGLSPLANVVYSRIAGRLTNGFLLTSCLALAAVASLATVPLVSSGTPYWVLAVAIGVANLGSGIVAPSLTATLVDAAGREHANDAASVLNANRQVGSLLGIAAMGVVLQAVPGWYGGTAAGFVVVGVAYVIAAGCAARLVLATERPG